VNSLLLIRFPFPALADHGSFELRLRCEALSKKSSTSSSSLAKVLVRCSLLLDTWDRCRDAKQTSRPFRHHAEGMVAARVRRRAIAEGWFKQKSKCGGTVEDHRNIALDVRELIRHRVFDQPVGSIFALTSASPGCV
jgi:hypothetical protein